MDKRKLKIIIKIFLSGLFIGYLVLKVDISSLASAIAGVQADFYWISTLLAVLSSIVIAAKYYFLIKKSSINHSVLSLVKINFITRFYSLFLPSAAGREIIRWFKVTRNQRGRVFFIASIVFERLTFLFVLCLCVIIPLSFRESNSEIMILRTRLLPVALLGVGFISLFILFFIFAPIRHRITSLTVLGLQRIWQKSEFESYFENDDFKNLNVSRALFVLGLSLIWQIFFICRLWILIQAASLPLNFMDVAWIGSLVLLLQTIPISFAGIGIRESAFAYLFTLFKLPPEKGVLIGLLFFSQMLIIACVGGVCEFFER